MKLKWTKKKIAKKLRMVANELGEDLTFKEYSEYSKGKDFPSNRTITKRFKTWNKAKKAILGSRSANLQGAGVRTNYGTENRTFCGECAEKHTCEHINELEKCEYWKEWEGSDYGEQQQEREAV